MLRKASEVAYWDAESAEAVLRGALELVARLEPPDDLRGAVFGKAADLLAQKHVELEQTPLAARSMIPPRGVNGR